MCLSNDKEKLMDATTRKSDDPVFDPTGPSTLHTDPQAVWHLGRTRNEVNRANQTTRNLPDSVVVSQRGAVTLVRLSRPAKRNALDIEMMVGIERIFSSPPEGSRAIVLHGDGSHFCDRRRTWQEIGDRVSRFAGALRAHSLGRGDRIAVLMLNQDRYIECYLAASWAGAVIVPLNIRWGIQENADALSDCGAKLLVVDNAFAEAGMTVAAKASGNPMLIYADDDRVPDGMFGYEALIAASGPVPDAMAAPDDLAAIFYTGGTTGRSKGVMLSHRNITANAFNCLAEGLRGTVGQICARGDVVMMGYWNRPEETAKVIVDGWMHTGDAGHMDEDGFIYIVDRVKDMIISGGENVYSVEVENIVAQHPAVAQCAVIGIPNETWGEQVHAIVMRRPGAKVDPVDITRSARSESPTTNARAALKFATNCRCLALARSLSANCVHRSGKAESGRSAESHRAAGVLGRANAKSYVCCSALLQRHPSRRAADFPSRPGRAAA
jgi:acyl-CoA synthetase (AMP-forming)/AMP-acid ligase II